MKALALILVLAMMLSGCNNLNDLRPVDPGTEIPEIAVKVVKAKFPKAEELVFKPILADKIWEVKLKSDAERYSSLVDYGKMWETFKILPNDIPSPLPEMVNRSAFGGGKLSGYTTSYYATTTPNKLIYNYKGEDYSFEWTGLGATGGPGAATFDPSIYRITTYEVNDLPVFVKDSLQKIPNLEFTVGYTWVRMDDSRKYYVMGRQKNTDRMETITMLFDDNGKLRWSSLAFSHPAAPNNSNLDSIPPPITAYLEGMPELVGYEYVWKVVNNVQGLTSYYIKVRKGITSECEIYFDKDFNVINKKFFVRDI
ncbi:hypothetical protein GCM10010967_29760 [Dyadobacter beijingensis]|uniref:PepSY-like beta-lactamase-inhibitor n=1 Tax=Dyadobacter beijingensis TaxID=365489 RepID=A0ABQ2I0D8_9BACT|nr:hypothetical protein [Dyadobacter beijingensis]GGM94521.1 hypothetical protein GCM10010967_29760 [Dyadobacter beijingensis]